MAPGDHHNNGGGGAAWTSSFSSNFAGLASQAAASLKSAVETATEAAAAATATASGGPIAGGGTPSGGAARGFAGAGAGAGAAGGGGGLAPPAPSYQQRQRLIHEQYRARTGRVPPTHAVGPPPPPPSRSPATVPAPRSYGAPPTHPAPAPSSGGGGYPATRPSASSPFPTPGSLAASSPSPSPTMTKTTTQTLVERLDATLDTASKSRLVASALGPLLPGERVIMFLNGLAGVGDSSSSHSFVGGGRAEETIARAMGEGGHCHGGGDGAGEATATVWCCAMTFYRVAVFSYRAGLDGVVPFDDAEEEEEGVEVPFDEDGEKAETGSDDSGSEKNGVSGKGAGDNNVVEGWIRSKSVSIQFQAAHGHRGRSGNEGRSSKRRRQLHHVFQMPLASIERVEKVAGSQQAAGSATGAGGGAVVGVGGAVGSIPHSTSFGNAVGMSSAASAASSAMSSLVGSQMKPLMGGGGDYSNGAVGPYSSQGNGYSAGSASLSPSAASGPLGLVLHGKDGGRWIRLSASSAGDAMRAHEALNTYAFPGRRNLGYLFAFESRRTEVAASTQRAHHHHQQAAPSPPPSLSGGTKGGGVAGGQQIAAATPPTRRRFKAMEEFDRQGIFRERRGTGGGTDPSPRSSPWAPVENANASYGLCSSYPAVLVGPRSVVSSENHGAGGSGLILRRCAAFRSENRLPTLTWGSSVHGGSIWRASQPKVGLQGNRSPDDERYCRAVADEAVRANRIAGDDPNRPPADFLRMLSGRNSDADLCVDGIGPCTLKFFDMRPKSSAIANRTQGYGYENTSNYRGTTITFFGIGNIHTVRDAYQKACALCLSPNVNDVQWMQLMENTNWPSMTRQILSAAWQTAFHVHYNRLPILLHCSHGWDRTSQVSALAQLMLDPHYRTREGFSTLIDKDFLAFGHPFHTRCGHGEGKNEQGGDEGQLSPIFLQFLDCAYQLVNQFPNYFEFNARYLLLISENIYSCRFGTLLCDSEREREAVAGIRQRTYCLWDYLDSVPDLINPFFDKKASDEAGVLMMPLPMLLRNVSVWLDRLCMYGPKATVPCLPRELDFSAPPHTAGGTIERPPALHTTRYGSERALRRAMEDAEMWKETALKALGEAEKLRKCLQNHDEGA